MCSSYPAEIVSNTKKSQIDLEDNSIFIRGVEEITEDDIEYNELLKSFVEKVVKPYPKELRRMSVSLMGEYKPEYICFYGEPDDYWDYNTDVNPNSIKKIETGNKPVYLSYDGMINVEPIECYLAHLKKTCKFKINIEWKPVVSNYYHFELRIFNVDTDEIISINSKSSYIEEVADKIAKDIIYNAIIQHLTIPSDLSDL